ncbi:hypothetical protein MVES1_001937 [Malassezia vespertilionis]|uniref:uncharacterized protein n=1 Tax=Malassezia vespertilionis TaxID=2020962 RepID=UPI0024B077A7|nr:uncharacterized protein MVES1_001937 [Malassezia vespertilionis]WFD06584.1 hypothetical protein MVES1_001937 [Malassezia vespertilionis]
MDLYLTAFSFPKSSASAASNHDNHSLPVPAPNSTLSSSPDARVVGSRAGLAVSPPSSLAPGAARPGLSRSPQDSTGTRRERTFADAIDGGDNASRTTRDIGNDLISHGASLGTPGSGISSLRPSARASAEIAEALSRLSNKVMSTQHCLVNVVPSMEVPLPPGTSSAMQSSSNFSTSPRPAASAGPGNRSVRSLSDEGEEIGSKASFSAVSASAGHDQEHAILAIPTTHTPKYTFNVCGTQSQVLEGRGALLQGLPFVWKVSIKVPGADIADALAESHFHSGMADRSELGMRLDEIAQVSGTNISIVPTEPPKADLAPGVEIARSVQIVLAGSVEAIEFARIQVLVQLDRFNGLHVEQFEIDRKLLHVVSGRKRAVLQLIEEDTNTSIYLPTPFAGILNTNVPQPIVAKRNTVYIAGQFYNTQRAKDTLMQLTNTKAKSLVNRQVVLMSRKIDWLLCERLEELRTLMLNNSTFLEFPVIGSQQNQVVVFGTSRVDVERSIRMLMQLVSPHYSANIWLQPGSYDALGVSTGKPDTHALSAILSSISASSGAEITFQSNNLEISGLDAEVRKALRELMRIPALKHYAHEIRFQLELASDHREFISGKKNGKINKIMEHCGVRIRFEPFNEYNFMIDVLGTELDAALQGLSLLQEELPAEMSFHVPEAYHKRIIGVGGKNIQRIMKKFGVYVKFSNAEEFATLGGYVDNDDNVIARTPSKNANNLENLKNSVMELVSSKDKDFVTEAVTVQRKYHRLLLGEKASLVHDIERKTRCTVRFARRESALDTVMVFGPESQINIAVQLLMQHVPLDSEIVVPNTYELGSMMESKDYALLVERMQKELGVTLTSGPRPPKEVHVFVIKLSVNGSNAELLTMAKTMFDELAAKYNVRLSLSSMAPNDAFSAPMPPFSSSLMSPKAVDSVATDTFHHDTAATAVSVGPVGTRYDEKKSAGSALPTSADLKALFDHPNVPGNPISFDGASSNTPLMSSFYTPGYPDSAGLSHPVWGAPLSSVPDISSGQNSKGSMFSPFSSGPMPFQFSSTDPPLGAPDNVRSPVFPHNAMRRTDAVGPGLGGGMDGHPFSSHSLGRLPIGMSGSNDLGNDIDGFHPISEPSTMPSLGMRHNNIGVPGQRTGATGMMRNQPASGASSDTMDEVSRALAQFSFDKQ